MAEIKNEIKKNITSQNVGNTLLKDKIALQEPNLINDFLFPGAIRNCGVCKVFLEEILKIKIEKVTAGGTEKNINLKPDNHEMRINVHAHDSYGTIHEVELQNRWKTHIAKYSRYYQSCINGECPESCAAYRELRKSCIMTTCNFDLLQQKCDKYRREGIKLCAAENRAEIANRMVKKTLLLN